MKQINAFIHKHRIAAVIHALREIESHPTTEGHVRNINVVFVQGLLTPVDSQEQRYSLDLAEPVIEECKLELLCEDDQADTVASVIAAAARTGQPEAGWICIADIARVVKID